MDDESLVDSLADELFYFRTNDVPLFHPILEYHRLSLDDAIHEYYPKNVRNFLRCSYLNSNKYLKETTRESRTYLEDRITTNSSSNRVSSVDQIDRLIYNQA